VTVEHPGRLPWHDNGTWLAGDTHCHYRLVGLEELAAHAAARCDFMAVTSHGHMSEVFEAQPDQIEKTRGRHPDLVLINGMQWEAPIGDSVTILMPGVGRGMPILREFLKRFDVRAAGIEETQGNFLAGLRFLGEDPVSGVLPAAIIQHPHGDRTFTARQIAAALDASPAFAGFCVSSAKRHASPGKGILHPWAADVGGVADVFFAEGRRAAMTAESDFHHHDPGDWGQTEFWPGEYRRTHLYCPEKTEAGVFAGLASGACYVVVGNLIDDLSLTAAVGDEVAMLGEELAVPAGAPVAVSARFARTGDIESLELIGNPGGETRVLAEEGGGALVERDGMVTWTVNLDAPAGTFFVRLKATGKAADPAGAPAALATCAIWVNVV
jgi:hypothetical protein